MKNFKKITSLLLVGIMVINISGFFNPKIAFAMAPLATSADLNNSTTTTVDMVVTGTDFDTFMGSGSTVAGVTDLSNIMYKGANPTLATIINPTTLTLTFPISIGTDKLGDLTIQPNTILDSTFVPNNPITVIDATITDSASPFVISLVRNGSTPTNATTIQYTVTFSEPVTTPAVTDFNLTPTGAPTVSATLNSVSPNGSPNSFDVTLTSVTGDGTIHLDLTDLDTIFDFASTPNVLGGVGTGNGNYTNPTGVQEYVIDNTAPVINSFPGFPPTEATSSSGATVAYPTPNSVDAVDGTLPAICSPASGATFALGTTTVTCNKTDVAGNIATSTTFSIDVVDTTAPVIDPYAGLTTFEANLVGVGATVAYPTPNSVDAVDGTLPALCTPASGSAFTLGTTSVTCDQTDAHGNIALQTSFNITVVDTTAPVITLLGTDPQTVQVYNPYIEAGATVIDNYDVAPTVTINSSAVDITNLGSYTVTYTSTDSNSNTSTVTRTVNVVDTTAPVITLLGTNPQTVQVFGTYTEAGATVTDNYWTGLTATINSSTVDTTTLGSYGVTYTATDGSSNTTTITRTVNVVDTTPPTITLNGASSITIEAGSAYTELGATVTDNYWTGLFPIIDATAINNIVPGSYPVTYTATDGSGNSTTITRTVNVQDTTPPVISPASDINGVEATSPAGAVVIYTAPNSTDIVDGVLPAVCVPASGSTFILGTTTVTCDKTDTSGNTATSVTFNITVVDTTAPVINPTPNMTGIEATSALGATVNYIIPDSTDAVDGIIPAACLPASGSTFTIGTTTVTCKKTDVAGNIATPTTFTIQVVDTTAPVIAVHANITVQATSPAGAIVTYVSPNATDAVDGTSPSICLPASGSTFAFGPAITITCNKTDSHGNIAAPKTFTIQVIDTTAPVITLNGSASVSINVNNTYTDAGATVTDNYDSTVVVTTTGTVNTSIVGTYTITYNSTDINGNVATPVVRTINVVHPSGGCGSCGGGWPPPLPVKKPIIGEVLGENIFKFTLDLKNGSRGNEVIELQKLLTKDGFYKGKTDGRFGKMTEEAVKKFQIKNNPLIINGIVDKNTRTILNGGTLPAYKFTLDLKVGSRGAEVIQLQSALTRAGFYNGKIDGVFGKMTANALKQFQIKNNIIETKVTTITPGVVEAKTRDILNKVK